MYSGAIYYEAFTQPYSTVLTAWVQIEESKQCTVGPSTVKHSPSLILHHSQPGENTRIKTMYSGAIYCEAFTQPHSTSLTAWAKIQESKQCTVGPSTVSVHSASFYVTHSLGENTRIKTVYSGAIYCEAFTQPHSTSLTAWVKIQESKQCTVGPSTVKHSPSLILHVTHSLGENTRIKTMYSGAIYCEAFTQPRSTSLIAWAKIQESKQCTVGPSTVKCSPSLILHYSQPGRKYKNQNNVQWGHLL